MNADYTNVDSSSTKTIVKGKRRKRLLSEAIQLEEEVVPEFIRSALFGLSLVVMLFLAWAYVVEIGEVAVASGEVVPSGLVKVVQHLEGGVVSEINVKEGDAVDKGAILARLSGANSNANLKQMEARNVALRLRGERLSAIANNRPIDFEGIGDRFPQLVADQLSVYRDQIEARKTSESVIKSQIEQRVREIKQLEEALKIALQQRELTGKMLAMRKKLVEKKLITKMVYLETKRAKVTANGEVTRIQDEISVAKQTLAESRNRLTNLEAQLRQEASTEMGQVSAEIAEVRSTIVRMKDQVERLDVKAPVRGKVQDLQIGTLGEVIQPGALLMKIVPLGGSLQAEIRISPNDIGYIHVGLPAFLKIGSYDYSRFGGVDGKLIRISPSSIVEPDGTAYFKGWISLDKPYVGDERSNLKIAPGMSVQADIKTGKKTLLSYLIKPVTDAINRSFGER